jgi:hypothetical protein
LRVGNGFFFAGWDDRDVASSPPDLAVHMPSGKSAIVTVAERARSITGATLPVDGGRTAY